MLPNIAQGDALSAFDFELIGESELASSEKECG